MTAILTFAGINASFMFTLMIPIQSQLPELLNRGRADTAWVVTATLVSAAASTPIAGRLGDLYGKRGVALALLAIQTCGSVLAAIPLGFELLIVGRVMQGVVIGVIPLGITILRDVLPPARLGEAIALMGATLGVGGALGLPVSAFISEMGDWRLLFWLAALIGLLNALLFWFYVPGRTLESGGRFDGVGAVALTIALSALLIAISKGNDWGWSSPLTMGFGLGGLATLVAWVVVELRVTDPLVNIRLSMKRRVLMTNLASVAMGFALFSSNVSLPQLLAMPITQEVGLGQSLIVIGLVLMPSGLLMIFVAPVAARLNYRYGAQRVLAVGSFIIFIVYALLPFAMDDVWQIFLMNLVIGVGVGLGFGAMPTLIMQSVPPTEAASANSLNTLMRSLGTAAAAAVVGAILAYFSVPRVGEGMPSRDGFVLSFVISAAAALASSAFALMAGPHPARHDD